MTAIQGVGYLWQPDTKEEKQASLTIRLNLAIEDFQRHWGDIMPQSCFTSEELPVVISDMIVPVYYSMSVTPYHLWLEFPDGFDFKKVKNDS